MKKSRVILGLLFIILVISVLYCFIELNYITPDLGSDIAIIIQFIVLGYILLPLLRFVKSMPKANNSIGGYHLSFNRGEKRLPRRVPLIRDIPCEKDIYRVFWVSKIYNLQRKETDFLGAIILKWIKDKQVEFIKTESKILKREDVAIKLNLDYNFDDDLEERLYKMVYEASDNGVLVQNEFKNWCSNQYSRILDWFDDVLQQESIRAVSKGDIQTKRGIITRTKYVVSSDVYKEAKELLGLKKFLIKFSKINDAEVEEVVILEDYLIYAQILGISNEVLDTFQGLYPEFIEDLSYYDTEFVDDFSYHGMREADTVDFLESLKYRKRNKK